MEKDFSRVSMNEEIRLDFLQNPKIDYELCKLGDYNFPSIASNIDEIMSFRFKLANMFSKSFALPFNFNCTGFLELFLNFENIYFFNSSHYEIRKAALKASNFINVSPLKIDSFSDFKPASKTLVIAPFINEDIFSFNLDLKNAFPDATLALDISYALALGLEIPPAHIYLINGAPLSLIHGMGIIISNEEYSSPIYKLGVGKAFYYAIRKRKEIKNLFNHKTNMEIFNKLQKSLGDDVSLFASNFAPNTLPLRFKSINTRNLIQHLYLDNVYIQSSQDCYLRLGEPSYTLLSMGFTPSLARELCALSFKEILNLDSLVEKIIQSYKIIKLMDF